MSIGFFIVGGLIFGVYMYFTLWNIFYSSKKQREENYPTMKLVDETDMDGMGNFSRFPADSNKKVRRSKVFRKKEEVA